MERLFRHKRETGHYFTIHFLKDYMLLPTYGSCKLITNNTKPATDSNQQKSITCFQSRTSLEMRMIHHFIGAIKYYFSINCKNVL
jgi:hypothetical protein